MGPAPEDVYLGFLHRARVPLELDFYLNIAWLLDTTELDPQRRDSGGGSEGPSQKLRQMLKYSNTESFMEPMIGMRVTQRRCRLISSLEFRPKWKQVRLYRRRLAL